jgi:hypothetical protein
LRQLSTFLLIGQSFIRFDGNGFNRALIPILGARDLPKPRATSWPGLSHGCPVGDLSRIGSPALPPPLWRRAGEGGRAKPRKISPSPGIRAGRATPLPNPPPQGGREVSRSILRLRVDVLRRFRYCESLRMPALPRRDNSTNRTAVGQARPSQGDCAAIVRTSWT